MPATLPSQFDMIVPFSIEEGTRVVVNQYGSGYKQRIVDGINADYEKITMKIVAKSDADANTLSVFLKARATDPLQWQAPGSPAAEWYLVDQPFSRQYDGNGTWTFSFTAQKVYL